MKLLRKIAPLAIAGLLLTTTVAAADLGAWKASFPGSDTAIVIGAGAAAQDTLGAVHIANALGVTGGGEAPVEGAWLVDAAGDELNYGESFFDIAEDSIDDGDLPTVLADGIYRESRGETENEEDYTQKLIFAEPVANTPSTDMIIFDNEEDSPEATDTYLYLDDGTNQFAYTYELKFDSPIEYCDVTLATCDLDEDFELTKLKMLGREYTIVDAVEDPADANNVGELVFMAGALKASQWEYSKATYTLADKTYEVEVKIISDADSTAVLIINGEETDEMEEGDTYTLDDGTRVGVVDVIPNEGAEKSTGTSEGNDLCTFYLGAEKIVFTEGDPVEVNGVEIEDSEVNFDPAGTVDNELEEIEVTIIPEDAIYLAKGESWVEPVLGRFKYTFQGLEKTTENIEASVSNEDGETTLTNLGGDPLEINIVLDANSDTWFGDENAPLNVRMVQDGVDFGGPSTGDDSGFFALDDDDECYDDSGANDPTFCNDVKFLVVSSGGEARVFEISDIDWGADATWGTADDNFDLKDLTTGDGDRDAEPQGDIDVGFTTINLDIFDGDGDATVDGVFFDTINRFGPGHTGGDSTWAFFKTSGDGEVDMGLDGGGNQGVYSNAYEGETGEYLGGWDSGDFDADGDMTIDPTWAALTWINKDEDNDDTEFAIDIADLDAVLVNDQQWGAIFTLEEGDEDEGDSITLEYPEERVLAKAYVSEVLATIPELATGGAAGAATPVLDLDIADVKDMNVIVVGGSAINRVAAEMLNVTFPTYGSEAGWTDATKVDAAGKAIIKLMDSPYTTGKFAMLVAGWEGTDTERAAKSLKEGTPAISGQSVLLNTATSTVTVITA